MGGDGARSWRGARRCSRRRLAECGRVLAPYVGWDLLEVIGRGPGAPGLDRVDVVQPVLWAVMVSLAAVWEALGWCRMRWWVIRRGRSRRRAWRGCCRWRMRRGWWRCGAG